MEDNFDELSKTREGRNKIMVAISNMGDHSDLKTNELLYWSYYHNLRDDDQYNYLRKIGNFEYPAMIKRIPHHRSFINLLASKQAKRGFPYSIYTSDIKSREKKYLDKMKRTVDIMMKSTKRKMILAQQQISMIDQQFAQIQQLLSMQPESEEMKMQQEQLQNQLPMIMVDIETSKDMLNQEVLLSSEELKSLDRYFKMDYKDPKDIAAQYMLIKLRRDLGLQKKITKNFVSNIVAGRAYFFIDYVPGEKKPEFKPLESIKVTYPSIETIEWVQDCPWVKIEERWTYNDIMHQYGSMLTEDERKVLNTLGPSTSSSGAFIPLDKDRAVDVSHQTKIQRYEDARGTGIKVERYFWKAIREIKAVQTPNKKNGKFFTHFVDTDKTVIMSTDYFYHSQTKKWINKKDEEVSYSPKDVVVINEKNGDRLQVRYVEDRYDGVIINDGIKKSWKSPIQLRSVDDLSHVPLPVVGPTFNGMTNYPYSLVGATIPFVETMELLNYHRELLLALTNIEGVVLDYSQKPKDMTDEEWYYQMKLGRYLIQTVVDGNQISSFNQFQRVGGSTHTIIQYIDQMIQSTYNFMGETMGVTSPSKGEIKPNDQVGTFERSIDQSSLLNEIIFEDYSEIAAKGISILSNLYSTYCLPKGELVTIGGKELDVYKLDPAFFENIDLECNIEDNMRQERQLQEIKTIMKQRSDVGQIPLHQFISLYVTDSITDLEKSVQYFAEEADKAAAQQFQNNEQAKAEAQAKMIQLKGEIEMKLKEAEAQLKMKDQELTMALEQMKAQQKQAELYAKTAIEEKKLQQEKEKTANEQQLKLLELLNEQSIESALINENRDGRMVDQKINALRLKMEALINGVTLELNKSKQNADHTEKMKKLQIEDKKASKMPVEHINDN